MNNVMILRGPDDSGYLIKDSFGMAMRRLSIIDLEGGHQPISNEDRKVHLVLNGEIYNYLELRRDLEQQGHVFQTRSDVEVLVHLYEDLGTDAIYHLNGMFAFCLWDENNQVIWLARDRLGIKPLVYYYDARLFAFGSTLDAITALPEYPKEIDEESFLLFMTLAYVPTPRCIFKRIMKLPPGHWLKVEDGKITIHQYWDIDPERKYISHEDFVDNTRELLHHSIELRSRSDVPVGCLLSGGIDSSAITALFCQRTQHAVHTFSMDFEGKEISELAYASLVAECYKTFHHPYELSLSTALEYLKDLLPLMDEPMSDSAIIPSYFLSKRAREEGIKVLLCGAGGDELYGGYRRHYKRKRDALIGNFPFIPRIIWQFLGKQLHPLFTHYGLQLGDGGISFNTSGVQLGILQQLLRRSEDFSYMIELLSDYYHDLEILEKDVGFSYSRMIYDVKHYLLDNVLNLLDKTSMAASMEGRVPLLDHRLVELVFSVTPEANIRNHYKESKCSLKEAIGTYLPPEILDREKAGFNAPIQYWVSQLGKQEIIHRLEATSNPLILRFFDLSCLIRLVKSPALMVQASESLFMLYIFDLWYESHS